MPDPDVEDLLEPLRERPDASGIFCDFDGTLAEIVDDPEAVRPLPGIVEALGELTATYARVGVVSGRPAGFLARWLAGRGVHLIGLYGLEWVEGESVQRHPDAERWTEIVGEAADRLQDDGPPGLNVERKGLSVTLHFRSDPSLADEARRLAGAEADRTGLVCHPGRMSFELRPPIRSTKGTAVSEATEGLERVCFMGDDWADLEAFEALGEGALRVAVSSDESPSELLEMADLVVDGPQGVLEILRALSPRG